MLNLSRYPRQAIVLPSEGIRIYVSRVSRPCAWLQITTPTSKQNHFMTPDVKLSITDQIIIKIIPTDDEDKITLGIDAPRQISILREELALRDNSVSRINNGPEKELEKEPSFQSLKTSDPHAHKKILDFCLAAVSYCFNYMSWKYL